MADALFVYGTLRRRGGQAGRLRDAVLVGFAKVAGRLYGVCEYPGMVRGGGEWVTGELYLLPQPDRLLAELDAYEGDAYTRERATALLASGEPRECWLYVYRGPVDEQRRIRSGDFLKPATPA